ncbi:MAG: glycosyltransferase family 87 protein [Tepidisphaeraceae bacterium]
MRLWQAAGLLLLFTLTVMLVNVLLPNERGVSRNMLGHDFLAFYTAGSFANEGKTEQLYDLGAVELFQRQIARDAGLDVHDVAPWWNPPHVAWLFAPLAKLPFGQALVVWTGVNVLCMFLSASLLMRLLGPHATARQTGLVPMGIACAFPTLHFLGHGQNTGLSLLLLSGVAWAFVARRAVAAGLIASLLAYKPQHAAIVSVLLVVLMGPRVLIGLAVGLLPQCAFLLLAMPEALANFVHQLPINLRTIQFDKPYPWDRHATLLAFWRQLLQQTELGPHDAVVSITSTASTIALGVMLALAAWRCWRGTGTTRTRLLALGLLMTPLLMPFYFDYDLLLLAVPATLVAREVIQSGITRGDRRFALGMLLLAVVSMLNIHIERLTGVNASVVVLTGVSLTLARSRRLAAVNVDADHDGMLGFDDLRSDSPLRAA